MIETILIKYDKDKNELLQIQELYGYSLLENKILNTYYEESLNLKVTHSSDQELIPNYSYSRFQHEAFSTWI